MKFGVCYYPEHWPVERWAQDAALFRAAGLSVVRLAEFAWSALEPQEGVLEWAWLDEAIRVFAAAGFDVVLGTPTAAPPDWLSHRYPETLPVDEQGRRRAAGGRRHYCPNSPVYQAHTERMVTALARRYGQHPAVRGWQIDNEFGGGNTARCYCPVCAGQFRLWLQARYGSLAALNEAWGTVFWSMTYHTWDPIGAPILNLARPNPSHVLDYYRFASASVAAYQRRQVETLRAGVRPEQWITHNFMGLYPDLDYFELAQDLDFVTWDSYPTGNAERWRAALYGSDVPEVTYAWDVGDPHLTGLAHDLTRGLRRRPFWIMEQQAGHINWGTLNPRIGPEAVRLWVWHALGSGADGIVYFRERATAYAQEQYHSGLLHHDGSPAPGLRAQQRLQDERDQLDEFTACPPRPRVALLWSYADLWALQLQPHHAGFSYLRHLFVYYRALQSLGLPVDVVTLDGPLAEYDLVIAPSPHLLDEPAAARLRAYVEQGGALVLSVRSGFKTISNRVTLDPLPGSLRELAGVRVAEWGALPEAVGFALRGDFAHVAGDARLWVEALVPETAVPRLWYATGAFAEQAALTEHSVGQGVVWYVGWQASLAQARALLSEAARLRGVPSLVEDLPAGLIAVQRGPHTILLNFTETVRAARWQGRLIPVPPRDVVWLRPATG